MKKPSELDGRASARAQQTTALVYAAGRAPHRRRAHPRARRRRRPAQPVHGRVRRRAGRARHRRHHLQFPLHRTEAPASRSRAGARSVLPRGHRRRARRVDSARHALFIGGKSMGGRIATQVAAADAGAAGRGPRAARLSASSARPARPAPRRAPAGRRRGRCCSCRAGATRSARLPSSRRFSTGVAPPPTLHVVAGGDHSFKLSGRDPATAGGGVRARSSGAIVALDVGASRQRRAGWAVMRNSCTTLSADQVLLDDALEDRRIAPAVPRALRIDDGDRPAFADAQAVRLRPQDAALLGRARAPSAASSGSPRPRGRASLSQHFGVV